jgi:methylthioribulose-1-phosphate dehydratase
MTQELTVNAWGAAPPRPGAYPDWSAAAGQVIEAGRRASQRGWVPATSGNFSVRSQPGQVAITRSGVDKGALNPADILNQAIDAALLPGSSAEAALHLSLYAADAQIGAVFHIHNLAACVLGRLHLAEGAIVLEGWELQKALPGVSSHEARVVLPVFANTQDIAALAAQVASRFAQAPADSLLAPGYVIAGHGLYAWGVDARQAWSHLEALDGLLNLLLALRQ